MSGFMSEGLGIFRRRKKNIAYILTSIKSRSEKTFFLKKLQNNLWAEEQEKKHIIQKSERETKTEHVEGIEHTKYLEITEKHRLSFVEDLQSWKQGGFSEAVTRGPACAPQGQRSRSQGAEVGNVSSIPASIGPEHWQLVLEPSGLHESHRETEQPETGLTCRFPFVLMVFSRRASRGGKVVVCKNRWTTTKDAGAWGRRAKPGPVYTGVRSVPFTGSWSYFLWKRWV